MTFSKLIKNILVLNTSTKKKEKSSENEKASWF